MWRDGPRQRARLCLHTAAPGTSSHGLVCLCTQVVEDHRLLPPHVLPSILPSFLPTNIYVPFLPQTCAMQQDFKLVRLHSSPGSSQLEENASRQLHNRGCDQGTTGAVGAHRIWEASNPALGLLEWSALGLK